MASAPGTPRRVRSIASASRRFRHSQARSIELRLPRLPEEARTRLLRTADAALAGRFPFFDRERDDLSRDPDWFLDPRTGRRAPDTAYAFDIDCRDVRQVGTIKYVWEPSRHYQLTVLAAAWFLTSDARYAEFAAAQLRSWWRHNPFLSGVHWTSGIELGVRLLSWVWIRRLLGGWPEVAALFEDNPDFVRQLHHHQEYLARLCSHGSSANNHIIAEAAGQFAASCAFPYFRRDTGLAGERRGGAAPRSELADLRERPEPGNGERLSRLRARAVPRRSGRGRSCETPVGRRGLAAHLRHDRCACCDTRRTRQAAAAG